MSRTPIAVGLGLAGFLAYLVGAVTLADHVTRAAWPVQVLYFLIAGVLWVWPARWLIIWAVRG